MPTIKDGFVLPRLETPRTPRVKSLGPEAIEWIEQCGILGAYSLLPWQRYAITRALELKTDPVTKKLVLRWSTVIITVSRQQGKSVLARALCWWRINQAERFGEPQVVLHTANLASAAREVWRPAALHAMRTHGPKCAKWGKGMEEIDLSEQISGRWLVQAASENTGVGFSISQPFVDEAWNVSRSIFEDALRPATSERNQPQAYLVSTAGDSSSDLLRAYREQALADTKGEGDVLLLEWSTPPDVPYDDPTGWRWASPQWTPRRQQFLSSQLASLKESAFRVQYLNQWVTAIDSWIPASVWTAGESKETPTGRPDVAAIEVSQQGDRYALISAWKLEDGRIIIRSNITRSPSKIWEHVEEINPNQLLLPPQLFVHYTGKRRVTMVGQAEMGKYMVGVGRAIADSKVLHDKADHGLTDDVGRAVAVQTENGLRLSLKKSPGPIEAARAMIWAVGHVLKPRGERPQVRVSA